MFVLRLGVVGYESNVNTWYDWLYINHILLYWDVYSCTWCFFRSAIWNWLFDLGSAKYIPLI